MARKDEIKASISEKGPELHGSKAYLTRYARSHDFRYPKFGRKLRKFGNKPMRKGSHQEDSAAAWYRAFEARGPKRKKLFRAARRGTY